MFRILAKIVHHVAREKAWAGLVAGGERLDQDIRQCYGRRAAVLECAFWLMATWMAMAVETWIALWALGLTASYTHAYVLESVAQGVRSVFFLVPAALGFQEGGYVVVGRLLGIRATDALALSLIHRSRELVYGIPGLLAWQWMEGRRLWPSRAASRATPAGLQGATRKAL